MRMLAVVLLAAFFPAIVQAQVPSQPPIAGSGCPPGQIQFMNPNGTTTCDTPFHHYGIYCPRGWTPPPRAWCFHYFEPDPSPETAGPGIAGPHMLYAYADVAITDQGGTPLLKPGCTDVGYVAPVCITWKNTFLNGMVDMDVKGYPTLVSRVSFYADTRDRLLTITRVEIPNLIVGGDGKLPPNPNGSPRFWHTINMRVRLYDRAVQNPDCSTQTWAIVGGLAIHYHKGTMEVPPCGDPGSGTYWGTDGVWHGGSTWGTDPDPFRKCYLRNGTRIMGAIPTSSSPWTG